MLMACMAWKLDGFNAEFKDFHFTFHHAWRCDVMTLSASCARVKLFDALFMAWFKLEYSLILEVVTHVYSSPGWNRYQLLLLLFTTSVCNSSVDQHVVLVSV